MNRPAVATVASFVMAVALLMLFCLQLPEGTARPESDVPPGNTANVAANR
ncbi:MAG TPA: hypothetical protein VGE14_16110 [Marmoricola sp.]